MSKTLIILNPHAGSGRAGKIWTELEPLLWDALGELVVAITQHPGEVAQHLDKAYASGLTRVISIGGDGTNHALVNGLADLNERNPNGAKMVYGNLPIGSGRDWARHKQIPMNIKEAARWIAEAEPHPTDIGLLDYNSKQEHFLNIASVGLSGEVDRRVNEIKVRRPWTFLQATVSSILQHRPQIMKVYLDGKPWYEGSAFLVAVANGSTFGHGMKIAPNAQTDDGLFDVVLVKGVTKPRILAALYRVYNGSHLTHPAVKHERAHEVKIQTDRLPAALDLDGEHASGNEMKFSIRPGLIPILS